MNVDEEALEREAKYWQAAHDRGMEQYLEAQRAHDKALSAVQQWEQWYQSLTLDRDRYRKWDEEKRIAIEDLQKRAGELTAAQEHWRAEHAKLEALLKQRDAEAQQLKSKRDLDLRWLDDAKKEIERLVSERDLWMNEHAKVVAQVEQWVAWHKSVQEDRDRYKRLVEKHLSNPLYYAAHFVKHLFTKHK